MFTEKEVAFLKSQLLARIATVDGHGQPDVVPVGFEFDGEAFYIGGRDVARTRKFRNVQAGQSRVALVIDELESVSPWIARGIRVYGTADLVERVGHLGPGTYLRVTPHTSWSWNVETPSLVKTVHTEHVR